MKLLLGTPRRFLWTKCRPGYVKNSLSRRQGECKRCGTCCQLVWKCKFYRETDGVPSCILYNLYRPANCTKFPIDHHDLADRNKVSPHQPCGFSWEDGSQSDDEASRN